MEIPAEPRRPSEKEIDEICMELKEKYPVVLWIIFGTILIVMLTSMVIKNTLTSRENMIPSIGLALGVFLILGVIFMISRLKLNRLLRIVKEGRSRIADGKCVNYVKKVHDRNKTVVYYYISVQGETIKLSEEWLLGKRIEDIDRYVKVIYFDDKTKMIWNKD